LEEGSIVEDDSIAPIELTFLVFKAEPLEDPGDAARVNCGERGNGRVGCCSGWIFLTCSGTGLVCGGNCPLTSLFFLGFRARSFVG
jgi:hypothetical protein